MTTQRVKFAQFIVVLVLTVTTIYWVKHPVSAPLQQGLASNIGTILSGYIVLSALVERSVEVIVGIFRTNNQFFEQELLRIENRLGRKDTIEYQDSLKEYSTYKAGTQQLTLLSGFSMGIFLASAGVGLLTSLLDLELVTQTQQYLIRAIDIVLTAGLLAGGSQAFHNIIANSIRDAVDGLKKNS